MNFQRLTSNSSIDPKVSTALSEPLSHENSSFVSTHRSPSGKLYQRMPSNAYADLDRALQSGCASHSAHGIVVDGPEVGKIQHPICLDSAASASGGSYNGHSSPECLFENNCKSSDPFCECFDAQGNKFLPSEDQGSAVIACPNSEQLVGQPPCDAVDVTDNRARFLCSLRTDEDSCNTDDACRWCQRIGSGGCTKCLKNVFFNDRHFYAGHNFNKAATARILAPAPIVPERCLGDQNSCADDESLEFFLYLAYPVWCTLEHLQEAGFTSYTVVYDAYQVNDDDTPLALYMQKDNLALNTQIASGDQTVVAGSPAVEAILRYGNPNTHRTCMAYNYFSGGIMNQNTGSMYTDRFGVIADREHDSDFETIMRLSKVNSSAVQFSSIGSYNSYLDNMTQAEAGSCHFTKQVSRELCSGGQSNFHVANYGITSLLNAEGFDASETPSVPSNFLEPNKTFMGSLLRPLGAITALSSLVQFATSGFDLQVLKNIAVPQELDPEKMTFFDPLGPWQDLGDIKALSDPAFECKLNSDAQQQEAMNDFLVRQGLRDEDASVAVGLMPNQTPQTSSFYSINTGNTRLLASDPRLEDKSALEQTYPVSTSFGNRSRGMPRPTVQKSLDTFAGEGDRKALAQQVEYNFWESQFWENYWLNIQDDWFTLASIAESNEYTGGGVLGFFSSLFGVGAWFEGRVDCECSNNGPKFRGAHCRLTDKSKFLKFSSDLTINKLRSDGSQKSRIYVKQNELTDPCEATANERICKSTAQIPNALIPGVFTVFAESCQWIPHQPTSSNGWSSGACKATSQMQKELNSTNDKELSSQAYMISQSPFKDQKVNFKSFHEYDASLGAPWWDLRRKLQSKRLVVDDDDENPGQSGLKPFTHEHASGSCITYYRTYESACYFHTQKSTDPLWDQSYSSSLPTDSVGLCLVHPLGYDQHTAVWRGNARSFGSQAGEYTSAFQKNEKLGKSNVVDEIAEQFSLMGESFLTWSTRLFRQGSKGEDLSRPTFKEVINQFSFAGKPFIRAPPLPALKRYNQNKLQGYQVDLTPLHSNHLAPNPLFCGAKFEVEVYINYALGYDKLTKETFSGSEEEFEALQITNEQLTSHEKTFLTSDEILDGQAWWLNEKENREIWNMYLDGLLDVQKNNDRLTNRGFTISDNRYVFNPSLWAKYSANGPTNAAERRVNFKDYFPERNQHASVWIPQPELGPCHASESQAPTFSFCPTGQKAFDGFGEPQLFNFDAFRSSSQFERCRTKLLPQNSGSKANVPNHIDAKLTTLPLCSARAQTDLEQLNSIETQLVQGPPDGDGRDERAGLEL